MPVKVEQISDRKWDLFLTPMELPIILQTSPETNRRPKNLFRPGIRTFESNLSQSIVERLRFDGVLF